MEGTLFERVEGHALHSKLHTQLMKATHKVCAVAIECRDNTHCTEHKHSESLSQRTPVLHIHLGNLATLREDKKRIAATNDNVRVLHGSLGVNESTRGSGVLCSSGRSHL